jgi:hypothetical protein
MAESQERLETIIHDQLTEIQSLRELERIAKRIAVYRNTEELVGLAHEIGSVMYRRSERERLQYAN